MYELVVTHPFSTYNIGDKITDQAAITKALASNPRHVVKVPAPAAAPSQAAPAPTA